MTPFTKTARTGALVLLAALTLANGATLKETRVAVMPFASESLDPRDLFVIAEAIRKAIRGNVLSVADAAETKKAISLSGCEKPDMFARESCLRMIARQVGAKVILGGTLNSIGSLLTANVGLYTDQEGTAVWSMDYEVDGTLEDFYKQVPPKLAETLPADYDEPPPPKKHVHARPKPPAADQAEPPQEPTPPLVDVTEEEPAIKTSAAGLVVGLSGLFALGDPAGSSTGQWYQSPQSYRFHAVYPTVKDGQVRLVAALPVFKSYKFEFDAYNGYPDALIGLEYEWSKPRAGIGVGLGYMYMQAYSLRGTRSYLYYGPADYRAYYESAQALNISVSLRGGKPNGAFYGHLSWPMPFIFNNNEPDNYYVEYSAMGVFGGRRVKAGVGISGFLKSRDADYITHVDTTFEYRDRDVESDYQDYALRSTYEYTCMLPCVKVAGLIAQHFVVTFDLELGGTIIPRQFNDVDDDWWAPYIGLGLVYSVGKMETVQVMDGRF